YRLCRVWRQGVHACSWCADMGHWSGIHWPVVHCIRAVPDRAAARAHVPGAGSVCCPPAACCV
ncbi:hypothetical protein FBU59_004444, partial [Linderina macrospora]